MPQFNSVASRIYSQNKPTNIVTPINTSTPNKELIMNVASRFVALSPSRVGNVTRHVTFMFASSMLVHSGFGSYR